MKKPTHEQIAQKAYEIWQDRGHLQGSDTEIWLEAEKQLGGGEERQDGAKGSSGKAQASTNTTIKAPPAAATVPDKETAVAAQQKQEARAPQVPHHTGPKQKPAPTGKPVWDKPHSA